MTRRTSAPGGALGSLGNGDLWTDALVLAGIGGLLAAAAVSVVWVAGSLVSLVTGHGVGPGLTDAARRLFADGLDAVWPGVPVPAVLAVAALLGTAGTALAHRAARRWAPQNRRDGFAAARSLDALLPGRAGDATARRLRASLRLRPRLKDADRGIGLGMLLTSIPARTGTTKPRQLLRATWEDVVLAICAPRSGKTTCLAVPTLLDAPGPVVATSNKPDLWQITCGRRQEVTGERVWTFDPQRITRSWEDFSWNPLDGVRTVEDARRLAGHFIQEIRRSADHADFWDRDAEDLLTGLLLAAAVSKQPITKVATWLTAVSSVEPRQHLAQAGFSQLAEAMAGRAQGAHETREGVYATARAATTCLTDPQITNWVEPRPGLDDFDPANFVRSRETLYLLSKDGAGSAAPLVAAFADRLMLEAVRAAEDTVSGRLDPPLVAVLDEAANICRITDLPRLYSHLGSRGVIPVTILQSRSQGRRVWGDAGMDELFSAATVKIIGAGIDEPAFAEDLSRLLGDEDVVTISRSTGRGGGTSTSTRRERVLPADEVRALPKFTALLLVTGVRPALVRLVPWMNRTDADDVRKASDRVRRAQWPPSSNLGGGLPW